MARYYMLLNWTEQGVRNAKETVNRAIAARQTFEKRGARLLDVAWTMGVYDLILSAEAPDDETIAAISMALSGLGNVKISTLRAFGEEEMRQVLQKV
ncbi:MAG: GYD domain-containing protein [Tepidisphaeraceae bacterium]